MVNDGRVEEEAASEDRDALDDATGVRPPGPLLPWMPSIPLFFLGLGVYRAWIEIVFVGSFVEFPAAAVAGHDAFDLVMIATMFVCAACAKRLGPLFGKRSVYVVAGASLTASTLGMFVSIWVPGWADVLAVPWRCCWAASASRSSSCCGRSYTAAQPVPRGAVLLGVHDRGRAHHLRLSRAAAAVAGSYRARAAPPVAHHLRGVGSARCRRTSFRSPSRRKFSFPWKIVLLMAIYAFAYGLKESSMYQSTFGPHSAFGTLAVAGIVFAGVIARGGKFDFGVIYRIALPLMVAAFLILPNVGVLGQAASDFCTSASYTAFSILIMLIMANLCYRYGMSAVWLFGIERGVRALFTLFGRQAEQLLGAPVFGLAGSQAVVSGLVVILVVAATMILFSEKELSSRWGVSFLGEEGAAGDRAIVKKQELANRCQELARTHGLSPREEEVLLLLAQHKTVGSIERELFIANGTAKTHIRHIYRKLDIHSRDELTDALGLFE